MNLRPSLPTPRELFVVVACFTVATLVLTLPLMVHPARTLPSDLIDTLLNTWIVGWDADRLRHGLSGVWDAPIFYPYHDALAFSENLFGVAFIVAPVYWVTQNPVLTYNTAFVFSFVLAGAGMYLLIRTLTQSQVAAAVGGAVYAFCPFRMMEMSHIQLLATGWIPIALFALHQYFFTRSRRWLVVFAAAYYLQALSNSYAAYFLALPVLIVFADGVATHRDHRWRRVLEILIAGLVIAAALVPVAAVYYRVRATYGQVRSLGEIVERSADVRSYLVAGPSIGVWRFLPKPPPFEPEKELFPGFAAIALGGLAVWRWRRRSAGAGHWVRLYGLIAFAGFAVSLGPHVRVWGHLLTMHGPYAWLLWIVPGMDGMRVAARFALIFVLGLSVVVGCGAMCLLSLVKPAFRPLTLAVCFAAIVADSWSIPFPVQPYSGRGRPEDRAVAEWLRERPAGAVLHVPIKGINFQELNYQYATLFHRNPVINGFSGYNMPVVEFLRSPTSPLYDYGRFPATVRMLRSLGVRYVMVHRGDYNLTSRWAGEIDRTIGGLRDSGQVEGEAELLGVRAFQLEPWSGTPPPEEAVVRISNQEFTASFSELAVRKHDPFDGDPETRWFGSQAESSWIAMRFTTPQDVALVELQLAERSLQDYPRDLQIDETDAEGRSRTVYQASPYVELMAGLLHDHRYPTIAIPLPHNEAVTLTIRASAHAPVSWSVHEVRLWRRP
jgi:hypothetical protein